MSIIFCYKSLVNINCIKFVYDVYVYFQVEPNAKLFPAVFVLPTSANLFQFEFVKIKVSFFPS